MSGRETLLAVTGMAIRLCATEDDLFAWGIENAKAIAGQPVGTQEIVREQYRVRREEIRAALPPADIRAAS